MDTKPLSKVLFDLFISGQFSDFTILCHRNTFPVHRAIICRQSRYFDVAANGAFKESVSKFITLPEDPRTILRLLCFLYSRDYDEKKDVIPLNLWSAVKDPEQPFNPEKKTAPDEHNTTAHEERLKSEGLDPADIREGRVALNNLWVYVAAEKYDIQSLKGLARMRFVAWLTKNKESTGLHVALWGMMRTVPPHDRELLSDVVKVLSSNVQTTMQQKGMRLVMAKFGVLAEAMLQDVAKENAGLKFQVARLVKILDGL